MNELIEGKHYLNHSQQYTTRYTVCITNAYNYFCKVVMTTELFM